MAVSDSINALVTLYMEKETPIVGKIMAVVYICNDVCCTIYLVLYSVKTWLCNEN